MVSDKFKVTGLFYERRGRKFRKYLDIKRLGSRKRKPGLMVVMMNPGSSCPLDGNDNSQTPTPTRPDNTQLQIMRVMDQASLDYARVLNLSDLRTPDSTALYSFVKSRAANELDHCIFSHSRRAELNRLFVGRVPVVFGWGVNPALLPLAKQAVEALAIDRPLGLLKPGSRYAYYHPLPRVYAKQLEWVQKIRDQLA